MPSSASNQPQPIVFSPRDEVIDAVRAELKGLGLDKVQVVKATEQCVALLCANARAMLIIDWAYGSEIVNQVLEAVKAHFKVEVRPIFLIIPDISPNMVATGVEYGVAQIHSGPISRQSIKECLTALIEEETATSEIRDTLVQVATIRSKDDWSQATPLLQQLHQKDPTNERVICELAENLIQEDAWQEAAAMLSPLTHKDPPHIRALHLAGRCWMALGDFDAAIGLFIKANLINPHNVERLIDLGGTYLKNNQVGEALETFKDALALDETSPDAVRGAGTAMLLAGEVNEALALLKTMSGPREMASIFNTAAVLAIRQHHFSQGMQLYQAALKAIGEDNFVASRLLFNMGIGFRRWGKPKKAVLCFEKSHALDPNFGKAIRQKDALSGSAPAPPLDNHMFEVQEFTLNQRDPEPQVPNPDEAKAVKEAK